MGVCRALLVFAVIGFSVCGWAREGEPVALFQPADGNGARSAGLVINHNAVSQLRSDVDAVNLGAVPLVTGDVANFRLTPLPIFSRNATIQLIRDDGTTSSVEQPDVKTWYGEDPDHPDRALFLAASEDGQVRAMVTGNTHTSVTVISRDLNAGPDTYRLEKASLPPRRFCDTTELPREYRDALNQDQVNVEGVVRAGNNNITYEIEMMIDVGFVMFEKFDMDASATMDYLTNLFGAVNAIYRRDLNVHFSLMHVTLWSTPDPFSALPPEGEVSTASQLNFYRTYAAFQRRNVPYDLAHFLDALPLGGRAYLDVLQIHSREVRSGVSNLDAFGDFPTDGSYYWDTTVVAHELGHNIGSPHSHCYKPPIDCCELECADCTAEKPSFGTIMSYCHLDIGNGGGVDMRFHERCIDLMRHRIESSLILSPYVPMADIEIRGTEGTLIPLNALDTARSTLFKASAVGASVTNGYDLRNTGGADLVLTGNPAVRLLDIQLQPIGKSDFSIITQPDKTTLAPGDATKFTIQYKPTVASDQWAVVEVRSNDADEGVYRFLIKGRLIRPSDPYTGDFNGNVTIPEQGPVWTAVPVVVEDVPGDITEVQVRFGGTDCTVDEKTGIQHPWVGDLAILLESPDGTTTTLVFHPGVEVTTSTEAGVGGRNFCHTILSDSAPTSIQDITIEEAPYSNSYQPAEPLSVFIGKRPNGTWKFWFYDRAQPDQGIVHQVSVLVRGDAAAATSNGPLPTPAENWRYFD